MTNTNTNTNNTKRKIVIRIAIIIALLMTIVGFITVEKTFVKITCTTVALATVHDNIKLANDQQHWDLAKEQMAIREKDFYESEDTVVRVFSNSPSPVKFVIAIISLIGIFLVPALLVLGIIFFKQEKEITSKNKRKKAEKRLEDRISYKNYLIDKLWS